MYERIRAPLKSPSSRANLVRAGNIELNFRSEPFALSSCDWRLQSFTIWEIASSFELIFSPAREAAFKLMSKCTR